MRRQSGEPPEKDPYAAFIQEQSEAARGAERYPRPFADGMSGSAGAGGSGAIVRANAGWCVSTRARRSWARWAAMDMRSSD